MKFGNLIDTKVVIGASRSPTNHKRPGCHVVSIGSVCCYLDQAYGISTAIWLTGCP